VSRSYSYDGEEQFDNQGMFLYHAFRRALEGKRGQKLLRDIAAAMDAMLVKRLVKGTFHTTDGDVCALGAAGRLRGVDMAPLNKLAAEANGDDDLIAYVIDGAARAFDVASSLAQGVMDNNDDGPAGETPEQRFLRVRRWLASELEGTTP
jgi:hypothetical protein